VAVADGRDEPRRSRGVTRNTNTNPENTNMALIGSFNATQVAPQQDIGPIPAGEYAAQIIDSDVKPTQRGDGNYAELTYEVIDGEFKGRKVWLRLNLDNPNQKAVEIAQRQLSAICHVTGVMQINDTQQLHYKPHVIRVEYVKADGVNSQKDSNAVKAWKKLDGSKPVAAPAPAAAAPAASNVAPPWARSTAA
jgi:hypothetical protein